MRRRLVIEINPEELPVEAQVVLPETAQADVTVDVTQEEETTRRTSAPTTRPSTSP